MKQPKSESRYSLAELTQGLDVTIKGDANCQIIGVCPIQQSNVGCITFLTNPLYRKFLTSTQASAVVLTEDDAENCPTNAVITRNPYYVYAKIAEYFDRPTIQASGIHPSVVVGEGSQIDPTANIGPHCAIGRHVRIGRGVVIGPGCVIGDDVEIGENSRFDANVSIYHRVKIGKRSRFASGVIVGSDGFGFANQKGVWHKVPQLGSVTIGDDVDIGANTAIDRGAVEDTIIENGVKLDNLIQVGHNVRIGANSVIAGCTGIAGSAVIGKNCMIGGGTMIIGHISICDGAIITGGSGVEKSINEPGMYSSGVVGIVPAAEFRKNNARFYRMDHLTQRVKSLEAAVKALTERE
jgi:UDP-3-O-[3-hydroxymyristoyl] glucosamine N-acyltransferase